MATVISLIVVIGAAVISVDGQLFSFLQPAAGSNSAGGGTAAQLSSLLKAYYPQSASSSTPAPAKPYAVGYYPVAGTYPGSSARTPAGAAAPGSYPSGGLYPFRGSGQPPTPTPTPAVGYGATIQAPAYTLPPAVSDEYQAEVFITTTTTPATAYPVYSETATNQPTYQQPTYQQSATNQPTYQQPTYQQQPDTAAPYQQPVAGSYQQQNVQAYPSQVSDAYANAPAAAAAAKDAPSTELDQINRRLQDLVEELKLAVEQYQGLVEEVSQLNKFLREFENLLYPQLTSADEKQETLLGDIDGQLQSLEDDLAYLHSQASQLREANGNATDGLLRVNWMVVIATTVDTVQNTPVTSLDSLARSLPGTLLQAGRREFDTVTDSVQYLTATLNASKTISKGRTCETGRVTLSRGDKTVTYPFQTAFGDVPGVVWSLCGFDLKHKVRHGGTSAQLYPAAVYPQAGPPETDNPSAPPLADYPSPSPYSPSSDTPYPPTYPHTSPGPGSAANDPDNTAYDPAQFPDPRYPVEPSSSPYDPSYPTGEGKGGYDQNGPGSSSPSDAPQGYDDPSRGYQGYPPYSYPGGSAEATPSAAPEKEAYPSQYSPAATTPPTATSTQTSPSSPLRPSYPTPAKPVGRTRSPRIYKRSAEEDPNYPPDAAQPARESSRSVGIKVDVLAAKTALVLKATDLGFASTADWSADVCFQVCSIGPGKGREVYS